MAKASKEKRPIEKVIKHSRENYWDEIAEQLEQGGVPPRWHVIHGLRSGNTVPDIVCEFIADALEENRAFRVGKETELFKNMRYAIYHVGCNVQSKVIDRWEKRYNRKMPDRQNVIYERVAKRYKVKPRTIATGKSSTLKNRRN